MTAKLTRNISLCLLILLLMLWTKAYVQSHNYDAVRPDESQITLAVHSTTSGFTSVPQFSPYNNSPIAMIRDYFESNNSERFPFRLYVTPKHHVIQALAAQINGAEEAYNVAVQWKYLSDQKLNQIAEKWLVPHEFLTDTSYHPGNPLKGDIVSDCEEQAYTLVSLMRADGIRPEEVRVVLGEVRFADEVIGHAWVELLINGRWVALDPSYGPYWDDAAGRLIRRRGRSFDYYASHIYPVIQVHAYFNDIYYLDLSDGLGDAPVSWYDVISSK